MFNCFTLFCALFLGIYTAHAKPIGFPLNLVDTVSNQARVSILTCGPGTNEYSLFGHAALRIKDPQTGFDKVYNYGTFDPKSPYFMYHFVRGDLQYWLSSSPFNYFLYGYASEKREVSEQVLALHPDEVHRLYSSLEQTLHSPAKYYRYQFFADNCSTRLLELLTANTSQPLQLDSIGIEQQTYRQLLAPYMNKFPWLNIGVNSTLGLLADEQVTFRQRLFLPAELQATLSKAKKGQQFLVAQTNLLFAPTTALVPKAGWWTTPSFNLLLICLIVFLIGTVSIFVPICLRIFLFIVGIIGCLLALISIFSLHKPFQTNYQILWFLPSHLLFLSAKSPTIERDYAKTALLSSLIGVGLAYWRGYSTLLPELWLIVAIIMVMLIQLYHRTNRRTLA